MKKKFVQLLLSGIKKCKKFETSGKRWLVNEKFQKAHGGGVGLGVGCLEKQTRFGVASRDTK